MHCYRHSGGKSIIKDAILKYGKENFIFEVLETVTCPIILEFKERKYIKDLNTLVPNGYNIETGGRNKSLAISDSTRLKLSTSHLGKKYPSRKKRETSWNKGKSSWSKGLRFSESHKKALSKGQTWRKKKIISSDGILYNSISEAARILKTSSGKICAVLNGKRKTIKGQTFKRIENG